MTAYALSATDRTALERANSLFYRRQNILSRCHGAKQMRDLYTELAEKAGADYEAAEAELAGLDAALGTEDGE
jgi:hypothetical protein